MATPSRSSQRIRFAEFELDLGTGELWNNGEMLTLARQQFQLLQVLLEKPGELVTRETLIARLWPPDTFVDFDQGLKKAVNRLREALSDCAEQPRFIETLPRRGYRFIADVQEEHPEVGAREKVTLLRPIAVPDEEFHPAQPRRLPWSRYVAFWVLAVVVCAAGIFFWRREGRPPAVPEVKQRRLTTNSSDNPVRSGAISPDGKYLAYADLDGLHVRIIETGETRDVPQPKELAGSPGYWRVVGWFPSGTSFIVNSTLPPEYGPQHPSVWEISVLAGQVRRIREDAEAWSISPDGSTIAFSVSTGHPEARSLWVMGSSGEQARKLFDADEGNSIDRAQWSPDGRRLAYVRYFALSQKSKDVIESRELNGGPATEMISAPGYAVRGYLWLPDGRIIYSLGEPLATPEISATDCNFWTLPINSRTGKPAGDPRKLTNWAGFCMDAMSVTSDTKKLAFVESAVQGTVYVADVHANGAHIDNVRPLTPSVGWSVPSAWASDGQSLIVRSNRDGRWRIYKQPLDGGPTELMVKESEEALDPRVLGPWVIYEIRPKDVNRWTTPVSVMRVPYEGGSPEQIVKALVLIVRCGRVSCISISVSQDLKQFVFTALDPIQGLGRELARADRRIVNNAFSLSPDGTQIAVLPSFQQSIDIYPVSGAAPWKVKVKGWPKIDNVNWAADGKGFYVFSPTSRGSVLLYADLQGNARVLWEQPGGLQTAGIPSLDGRHLAIRGWTVNSNVWMMENF